MDQQVYFRRCHVCGTLNHSHLCQIDRCVHCNKPFAQFQFFDDREIAVTEDRNLRPPGLPGQYEPVRGITVFWDQT